MVPRKKIIQQKIVAIDGMHCYGINPSTAAHVEQEKFSAVLGEVFRKLCQNKGMEII